MNIPYVDGMGNYTVWANYIDQTAGWSPQMVVNSKGIHLKFF